MAVFADVKTHDSTLLEGPITSHPDQQALTAAAAIDTLSLEKIYGRLSLIQLAAAFSAVSTGWI